MKAKKSEDTFVLKNEATPYIWAQEIESVAQAECGCKIEVRNDGPALYRCLGCVRAVNAHEKLLNLALWVQDSFKKDERPKGLEKLIAKARGAKS